MLSQYVKPTNRGEMCPWVVKEWSSTYEYKCTNALFLQVTNLREDLIWLFSIFYPNRMVFLKCRTIHFTVYDFPRNYSILFLLIKDSIVSKMNWGKGKLCICTSSIYLSCFINKWVSNFFSYKIIRGCRMNWKKEEKNPLRQRKKKRKQKKQLP